MNYKIEWDFEKEPVLNVEGRITCEAHGRWNVFLDGWIEPGVSYNDPKNLVQLTGVYNLIYWDSISGQLIIENDRLGQRPLYASFSDRRVILSDNFWVVTKSLEKVEIDDSTITQLQLFRRLVPSWKTVVKNVYRLPAGSRMTFQRGDTDVEIKQIKWMKQQPDSFIDNEIAADQLHKTFMDLFGMVGDLFPKRDIWFGNSGGLDSRLIPAYAEKAGIKVNGYLVSNKKRFLKNQSEKSADIIAKKYGFSFKKLRYDQGNGWSRLLRDLYVNPFGPANFHKNPQYEFFKDTLILTGGDSFTIVNDNNFWKTQEARKDPVRAMVFRQLLRKGIRDIDVDGYKSIIERQISICLDDGDAFSTLRSIHQVILNQTSPAGAFESMNLAGEFQYIYHPFATEQALKWPEELFYDRKVQSQLFKKYFPDLLLIPDQHGNYWEERFNKSFLDEFLRKVNLKVRTSGLDYRSWVTDDWVENLKDEVLKYGKDIGSVTSVNILNKFDFFSQPQDKLDMLKLSAMTVLLEEGSFDICNQAN